MGHVGNKRRIVFSSHGQEIVIVISRSYSVVDLRNKSLPTGVLDDMDAREAVEKSESVTCSQ